MPNFIKQLIALMGLLAIVMVAYLFVARPYQLHWGATEEEISAPMPGDDFDTSPDFLATRAITIQGTPQEIWRWLISRFRWSYDRTKPLEMPLQLLTEFTDRLAVRKILMGIKGRVEGEIEPIAVQNTEFVLFLISAFTFIAALILLLVRPLSGARWLAGLGAGLAWLIT